MAKNTLYVYDLETSGVNPRESRIMQFAGQRVDMNFVPIGEPHNFLIKLSPDVLPDPYAVLVTGITPQKTLADGITEVEFLKIFHTEISTAGTIFLGYNSVRFDDEFMRYLMWRNFYDAYEWQWKDDRSRWDLLDVVRMTRALRPDGIEWPFASDGTPSNRLELLTSVNKLAHDNAHDALSDVHAVIELAKLLLQKQPKLLKFALDMRSKSAIAHFLSKNPVFLYTSGKYPSEYEKTTIVTILADHPKKQGVLVYDLRYDPTPYLEMSTAELVNAWRWKKDSNEPRLPVKSLQFNRCPAVAPLGVLDSASEERIQLTPTKAKKHLEILHSNTGFSERVLEALVQLDTLEQQRFIETTTDVDARLYDGFVSDFDKQKCAQLVALDAPEDMPQFKDTRLQAMFPLYKARNFVQLLSPEERETWESYREQKLLNGNEKSRSATFFKQLEELATRTGNTPNDGYLLEELQLYAQSILPYPDN